MSRRVLSTERGKGILPDMQYRRFVLGPIETNSYVIHDGRGNGVLVDPADVDAGQTGFIESNHLKITAILITHSHVDHVYAAGELSTRFSAPLFMHEAAEKFRDFYRESCGHLGYPENELPCDYTPLGKVKTIPVGQEALTVLPTPGHSACGVSFLAEDFILTGDLLFKGSIGRYDLPGASLTALYSSLKKIKKLAG